MRIATIALAASLLAGTATVGLAADLGGAPPPRYDYNYAPAPAPIWQGFYIGGNVGYAWGAGDHDRVSSTDGTFRTGLDNSGAFGGGQFGYNAQYGNIVAGIEADIQGGDVNSSPLAFTQGGGSGTLSNDINVFGTIRGRLGYAMGPWLLYATGGFAWADVDVKASGVTGAGNAYSISDSSFATGYVVGAGVEYALSRNWSIKGEYQYLNLDAGTIGGTDAAGSAVNVRSEPDLHTVRMGLNYRF